MMKPLGDINTSKLNTGVGLFKHSETKAFILQVKEFDSNFLCFHFYCCRCLHLNKNFIFLGPGFPPSLACMEVRDPLFSWATPARAWKLSGFSLPLQLSVEVGIELLPAPSPSENWKGFFPLLIATKARSHLCPCICFHVHCTITPAPGFGSCLAWSPHAPQKHHNPPKKPWWHLKPWSSSQGSAGNIGFYLVSLSHT